jgi:uncharacterized protein
MPANGESRAVRLERSMLCGPNQVRYQLVYCSQLKFLDLLVIGTGRTTEVLSPKIKKLLNNMGIRVEVVNTRNAAAQYNLLAIERGIHEVAAALVPAGWTAAIAKEVPAGVQ